MERVRPNTSLEAMAPKVITRPAAVVRAPTLRRRSRGEVLRRPAARGDAEDVEEVAGLGKPAKIVPNGRVAQTKWMDVPELTLE